MQRIRNAAQLHKPPSVNRRSLRTLTLEGVPALMVGNLLGGPFLTGYMLYLGATSEQVGIALAIPAFANLIQLFIAFYMHRFPNRKLALVLLGGSHRILWALTGFIPFLMPKELWVGTFIGMFLLSFVMASASGVFWTSLVADIVPAKVRGRYFGIRNTIHGAVAALAVLVGGQILDRWPEETGFMILYAIALICTVVNIYYLACYPNPTMAEASESKSYKLLLKPFKDRTFFKASLFLALWILLQNAVVPLFSYMMLDVHGISIQWVSIITTMQMLVMMASYYIWGNLNARYRTRTLLFWTLPMIGLSCLLWGAGSLLPILPVLVAIHILLGFGTGGFNQLVFNLIIEDAPRADVPIYIAVYSGLTGITGFLGPLIGGMLFKGARTWPNWIEAYGIAAVVGGIMLGIVVMIGRKILLEPKIKWLKGSGNSVSM
ncbi:MFS transporter [Paenibacillus swuensis]|uniref:MFS transporter n=1 Tax=Paenibacillus swuensis TaxID=1178515 RepID=A0A172TGW2_9BACL|nr:MFS transporter [Paenibacillus swuensis]ANE46281.1 MFS transporter [Paenibacillus swuensis]